MLLLEFLHLLYLRECVHSNSSICKRIRSPGRVTIISYIYLCMLVTPVSLSSSVLWMNLRSKPRLDYKILHQSGERALKMDGVEEDVLQNGNEGKPEDLDDRIKEITITEMKTREDLEFSLDLYEDVQDFETKSEVREAIATVTELLQVYRNVNFELKVDLGNEAYLEKYRDFDTNVKKATEFLKEARKHLKVAKNDFIKNDDDQSDLLKIEQEVLDMKITQLCKGIDLGVEQDTSEIENFIRNMESFVSDYFDLCGKSKRLLGAEHDEEGFKTKIEKMTEKITLAKEARKTVLEAGAKRETESSNSVIKNDQILRGKNLSVEIIQRLQGLETKFDQKLDTLGDYQILEISQNKTLETDFNTVLEKITELAGFCSGGGEEVENLLKTAIERKDEVIVKKNTFFKNLQSIVSKRDVTADKLKNAASLTIDIPKFSGYDCKIDFYTFKTEFQNAIEPIVQAPILSDYLKRNYLTGSALNLVEKESSYEEIWKKLAESFGNARLLLQNKLAGLDAVGGLWKLKNDEKIMDSLAKIVNAMTDLSTLASEHKVEGQLYEGGGLEKIMSLLGDARHMKFRSQNLEMSASKKDEWDKLSTFLNTELNLRKKLVLDIKNARLMGIELKPEKSKENGSEKKKPPSGFPSSPSAADLLCHFCGEGQHVVITTSKGNLIIPYYVCAKFVALTPSGRYSKLKAKNLCTTCLLPGAVKSSKHRCFYTNFCCPHTHSSGEKIHVLLCELHKSDDNKKLAEKFKDKFVKNCTQSLPQFCQSLSLLSFTVHISRDEKTLPFQKFNALPDVKDNGKFLLQTIQIENIRLNIFYDNGCGDLVIRKRALDLLAGLDRVQCEIDDTMEIIGVGDQRAEALGLYSICLTMHDGTNITLSGMCMTKITHRIPIYPLEEVESDLRSWCTDENSCRYLPKLSSKVGGETDILLGSKYLRYFPKLVYEHESGLRIHKSVFKSPCGSRGVVEGPHPKFSETERKYHGNHVRPLNSYFTRPVQIIRSRWKRELGVPLLGWKSDPSPSDPDFPVCCSRFDSVDKEILSFPESGANSGSIEEISLPTSEVRASDRIPSDIYCSNTSEFVCPACAHVSRKSLKSIIEYDALELTGTEVTFRCPECKECLKCKNGPRLESVSIQEEVEEALITRCVTVDPAKGTASAKLPFLVDPENHINVDEQKSVALKVFQSQVRNLSQRDADRSAVIESEQKLQDLGFVDWVSNLSEEEQALIKDRVQYFIPWRAVHNENSVSTPCRLVFDASQSTRNGSSLNSLLAKGLNSLNSLLEIMIRWTTHAHAFHTDISKMYNRVSLDREHWRYQLYYWAEGLTPGVAPDPKVVKTVIYGVRSSGNIAQCALRQTAELNREKYPKAFNPITEDTYMDDCMSGTNSLAESQITMDQIQSAVATTGFSVKGLIVSGEDPPIDLSDGKDFILCGGMKWFSKGDFLGLNIPELNFSKKVRGKKALDKAGIILEHLTKVNCVSRSSEVFDLFGLVAPIMAGIKIDVSDLHKLCPKWDDPIPSALKELWVKNFGLIDELKSIRFHRAVVPSDAASLDIETIETADAGEQLVCAAIYARFQRKNGSYSCQLILARTKVVHELTIPRAELEAALLNASSGHLVKLSLKEKLQKSFKLSDSQVALHWINCLRYALKMWVRNRVVEVNRLTDRMSWFYVGSKHNIADLATRKGAQISDVLPDSPWIKGQEWMSEPAEKFPVKNFNELILSKNEKTDADKEKVVVDLDDEALCLVNRYVPNEVGDRYSYSQYLIDPNKFRFKTVLRILALVFIFLKKIIDRKNKRCNTETSLSFLRKRDFSVSVAQQEVGHYFVGLVNRPVKPVVLIVPIQEEMLNASRAYFFEKASAEVLKFVDPGKYKNISTLKDGILYHTGRILLVQEIDGRSHLADACLDLSASTFCVPITDAHSPVAYAIVSETHWYSLDVSHGGIESVLRYSQQTAFIIGGRSLVKCMKKECPRCRFLEKKGLRVAMGPVSDDALRVAPVFFVSQVDICGPFNAYSPANKRATVKIWFVVFVCSVTGATDCRVMEDYSADGFVMAFIRFSCRFGYPKKLLPDEGSQLVKGCKNMVLSMSSLTHKLSVEYGVEFETAPVGAHNVHGKVERKIQQIKKSFSKQMDGKRLSVLQWETLGQQVANSVNNLPIGLGNKTEMLESLDILSPNRLILGRNNCRSPTAPLEVTHDVRRIVESNKKIYDQWFQEWLISYVPKLVEQPKWFASDRDIAVGDVVLFLKSEKEFDLQYQYGIVATTYESRDGLTRTVDVEYQNAGENIKRRTRRGVRELVVIHSVDEIGISEELYKLANGSSETERPRGNVV